MLSRFSERTTSPDACETCSRSIATRHCGGLLPIRRIGEQSVVDAAIYLENAQCEAGEIPHADGGQSALVEPRLSPTR
jgi:hypothetical protein